MKRVILATSRADRKFLENHRINLKYVEHVLNIIIDTIRPSKSRKQHKIKLELIDDTCSLYYFSNKICITRQLFKRVTPNKARLDFLNDLFHEFGHYIQYKVDKLLYSMFAVDHDTQTYKSYFNNLTERQARKYGNLAKEALSLYIHLEKLHKEFKVPLNSSSETSKKTKKTKATKNNQAAKD